ncbi:GWxTD domain-containing protein [candidate division KSB1 bacterium]|nr:GWxTD domain-containing protein [candidate division KSB1 bacterium]
MRKFLYFFVLCCLIHDHSYPQVELKPARSYDLVEIAYDLVNVSSSEPGMSRLNIYLEISYDDLQFIKTNEIFEANYELSVVIYDADGDQVDGKIWQRQVTVTSYDATNSQQDYIFDHSNFHLEPGEYEVVISLTDANTKQSYAIRQKVLLKDFSERTFSLSDITLTNNVEVDSLGVKSIKPIISSFVRTVGNELFAYFEVYTDTVLDKMLKYEYKIINSDRKVVEKNVYERRLNLKRTLEYFKIDKNKLGHGVYSIVINAQYGSNKDEIRKSFALRWAGMPASIVDIKKATEQLKYIATKKEIDIIKKAAKSDRLKEFEKFWNKKDPTPGTARNELMDVYYGRIDYSNKNFGGFREGWKSDMGMIYIIFGPPNDIERHPFERGDKPSEIWYYYNLNRYFYFYDETGFGEYLLVNPDWRNMPKDGIYY